MQPKPKSMRSLILFCISSLMVHGEAPRVGEPFEVLVSEPRTIHVYPAGGSDAWVVKLANGSLVTRYRLEQGRIHGLISSDNGNSWAPTTWPGDSASYGVLSDGTVLALSCRSNVKQAGEGKFIYGRWVSRDNWKTWEGPLDTPVNIPNGTGGTADDWNPFNGPIFWRGIVELPDGRLLATAYGYFVTDKVPIEDFKPIPGFYKYRTLLLESKDRGASWSLVTTIAYDPTMGQEGPCEPSLVRLPNGELLVMLRTGYRKTPMYSSRSRDNGRTWSRPESVRLVGVDPQLLYLSTGQLACAYGVKEYDGNRRERRIMFSEDGGKTWSHNTIVYVGSGSIVYPDAVELEPGKILYVFVSDALQGPKAADPPMRHLRLATVTIRRPPDRNLIPFPIVR